MPPRRVTIRDVARAAGVSTATVSEALSGRGRTAEETRERVRKVAEEIGYVASAAARSLRLGRSGAIGLYVPDRAIGFEYYVHLSRGAAEEALGHGFALTLVPAWHEPERLRALHMDGLIVCDPALDDPVLRVLKSLPVPMVTCERDPSPGSQAVGMVGSDHMSAMASLLTHMGAAGAGSVAVLAPGLETNFGQQVRLACAESTLDVRVLDIPLAFRAEDVERATEQALTATPDALIAVPDGAVLVALPWLHAAGVRVPDDLLLASYVDGPSLQITRPAITAVDIDPRLTGASAVQALVEVVVGGGHGPIETEVPVRLCVRQSTVAPDATGVAQPVGPGT